MRYSALAVLVFSLVWGVQSAEKVNDNKAILGTWRGGWPDDKTDRFELVIYQLDGDTLKWASNNSKGPRPSEMIHKPGSSFLMVLKKVK